MFKNVLLKVADFLGFKKSSRYVKNYIHRANMRSGIFMSAVIFILEIWLVIRQAHKYIAPALKAGNPFFQTVFTNTSYFWLLMFFGFAMFFYCIYYVDERKRKWLFWASIIAAIVSLTFVAFLPFEFYYKSIKFTNIRNNIYGGLRIGLYGSVFLFDVSIIVAMIYTKHGGLKSAINSMIPITLFALVC